MLSHIISKNITYNFTRRIKSAYYMKRALGAELECQSECDRLAPDLATASIDQNDINENCAYLADRFCK